MLDHISMHQTLLGGYEHGAALQRCSFHLIGTVLRPVLLLILTTYSVHLMLLLLLLSLLLWQITC